jgi:hypothetical protein
MGQHPAHVPSLDELPGFRRRIIISPSPGRVTSDVEDDYHCMGVVLHHANGVARRVEAVMTRVPWTTCPGAPAALEKTFTGVALEAFAKRGEKRANCTHLHDLAVFAAAHAMDDAPLTYDILVSDPVAGRRSAELRRNGVCVLAWVLLESVFVLPAQLAGTRLDEMNPWIGSLDSTGQEYARILRWGTMLAHGRAISDETRSDKVRLPLGQCFTFQPETMANAHYIPGTVHDFSRESEGPLVKHRKD